MQRQYWYKLGLHCINIYIILVAVSVCICDLQLVPHTYIRYEMVNGSNVPILLLTNSWIYQIPSRHAYCIGIFLPI